MIARIFFIILALIQLGLIIFYFQEIRAAYNYQSKPLEPVADTGDIRLFVPTTSVQPGVRVTTNKLTEQSCYLVGDFKTSEEATKVLSWLNTKGVKGRIDTKVAITNLEYKVYVGDFEKEEDAEFAKTVISRRNDQLKQSVIYKFDSNWRVSFGVFDNKNTAEDYKEQLEESVKGIKIFIETNEQTETSSILRYTEKAAEGLLAIQDNEEVVKLLEEHGVAIKNCYQ